MSKEPENILRMFQDVAERRGKETCLRFKKKGLWQGLTWNQTLAEVRHLSECLKKLGIGCYDRVALLSTTRYEWTLLDMAILSLGGVTVPIYHSSMPDEVMHILNDSEARVIVVEDSTQLEKVLRFRTKLPHIQKIVLLDGRVLGENILTYEEFRALGAGVVSDFGARVREISWDNLATLVYTSGTTGRSKGVMLTHGNIASEVLTVQKSFPVHHDDIGLIFLPLAHILARVIQFYQLATGFTHAYAESIDKLIDNIQEVKPHFMVSVPRIFEKIYSNMMHNISNASATRQSIFYWAKEVAKEHSQRRLERQPVAFGLKLRYTLATQLVFSKLHKKLGGRIRFFISGGAPLSREIAEFFHGAGVLILEGYGLTETTAAINLNLLSSLSFGSVGVPLDGVEEKIAPDGEILVRGPMISPGYWKNPEATTEAIDAEGWFHTGDIGEFDDQGRLRITDRKKDLIITAAGKNIAPQYIENLLKTDPFLSQAVVHGDKRKYLTALVTLNPEKLREKAREWGIPHQSLAELVQHPRIQEAVKKIIDEKNQLLPKYETIKRFAVLDQDFSIEGGELTPTLKVKRKVINERYQDVIERLYTE